MICSIVLIWIIATTITGRYVKCLQFIIYHRRDVGVELFQSEIKVSVSLHQK